MKLSWKPMSEGFVIMAVTGDASEKMRTRRVAWTASARDQIDRGVLDLCMADAPFDLPVRTGWKPESVDLQPVRDQTPGIWQPWRSTIPAGVCEIAFETTTHFECRIDLLLSSSGHPADTRSVASVGKMDPDQLCTFAVPSKTAWVVLMLKKMTKGDDAIGIKDLRVFHAATGNWYETAGHLIKPEHKSLEKLGSSTMLWRPDAPVYSYFSVGFQRVF